MPGSGKTHTSRHIYSADWPGPGVCVKVVMKQVAADSFFHIGRQVIEKEKDVGQGLGFIHRLNEWRQTD